MKLKSEIFPYPVLSSELDDFSNGKFESRISQKVISFTKIELLIDFVLENFELNKLIEDGDAVFAIHIEGLASSFRKLYILNKGEWSKKIELSSDNVPSKIFINTMIIANNTISNYRNSGFNEEYYGRQLIIEEIDKGSILAYDTMAELEVNFSNLEKPTLKSMIRVASKKQNFMNVDFDGDVIIVNLPEKSFIAYTQLSSSSISKQKLLLSTIILPALTMIVENIKHGRVDDETRWYESLCRLLEKIGLSLDKILTEDIDSMIVAQQLLDFPLDDALYSYYSEEENL
ncbi:TPA: hypothetical protein U2B44_001193 [Streptococcus suis]|uniref:hypothetical protein n=1 Tax=Streptococcus suis TaxID=1307 RepID=UPI000CF709A3|nr:hypothetical protein [Streptococcus suis]NQK45569.1 hypothetical protein [Streptococcus suis]HEM5984768.1 hypothetical protein [Streptococcus suis]